MLVSVLINTYRDKNILPLVVDLIFKRNRNEQYIHDLVWALFRSGDLQVLRLIAEYIKSSDPKDVELATKLLNIDEANMRAHNYDQERLYESYLNWLEENQPYLYFTQESFHYTSKPIFYAVNLQRKNYKKDIDIELGRRGR